MKRLLAILLLLAFTAGTSYWGFRLAWEKRAARLQARQLILEGIDADELVQFSYAKASQELLRLEWKDAREFRLEGQLYDIVTTRESADSVHYTCYPDKRESQVDMRIGQLTKCLFGQQPFQREREQQWVSFLRGLMLPQEPLYASAVWNPAVDRPAWAESSRQHGFPSGLFQPPEQ